MKYTDFPDTVSGLKGNLSKYKRNYSIKMYFGSENSFVVGMLGNGVDNLLFSEIQFINTIENTKNNFLLSVSNYLSFIDGDKLLPDINSNPFHEITNPYYSNPQYFWLENMVIRLGSLWDELAHLCNMFYKLEIDVSKVQSSRVFNKNKYYDSNYPIICNVIDYFENNSNFIDNNCHHFVVEIRNRLIHYCDFKAIKFMSDYLKDKDPLGMLPIGVYFGYIMFDYFSFIDIFDNFMQYFNKSLNK